MLKPAQSLNIKDSSAVTNSIDGSVCYKFLGFPQDFTIFINIQNFPDCFFLFLWRIAYLICPLTSKLLKYLGFKLTDMELWTIYVYMGG